MLYLFGGMGGGRVVQFGDSYSLTGGGCGNGRDDRGQGGDLAWI